MLQADTKEKTACCTKTIN